MRFACVSAIVCLCLFVCMITDQPCLPESGGNYNARLKRSVCVCVSARITANVCFNLRHENILPALFTNPGDPGTSLYQSRSRHFLPIPADPVPTNKANRCLCLCVRLYISAYIVCFYHCSIISEILITDHRTTAPSTVLHWT